MHVDAPPSIAISGFEKQFHDGRLAKPLRRAKLKVALLFGQTKSRISTLIRLAKMCGRVGASVQRRCKPSG